MNQSNNQTLVTVQKEQKTVGRMGVKKYGFLTFETEERNKRTMTVEVYSNVYGQMVYTVRQTGFTTKRFEDLQKKYKVLNFVTETELLAELQSEVA